VPRPWTWVTPCPRMGPHMKQQSIPTWCGGSRTGSRRVKALAEPRGVRATHAIFGMAMLNLDDVESAARAKLPAATVAYFAGGANDEHTLRANRVAFDRLSIRYRTMVDVSARSSSTTVLGQVVKVPVLIAPTALQRLAHDDGERATARAAERAGTVMVVSTTATTHLSDVRAAAGGPMWFQTYLYRDRGVTRALLESAAEAGYQAIMLTVDTPLLGGASATSGADSRSRRTWRFPTPPWRERGAYPKRAAPRPDSCATSTRSTMRRSRRTTWPGCTRWEGCPSS
jgi:hypothetical protein